MKSYRHYWTFSAIRGAMTLLAAVAVVAIPQAAASMLSIPVMATLAVSCLATYSFFDAGILILLARVYPVRATSPKALYGQAALSMFIGALLSLIAYGLLDLRWLMGVVAVQAALAAVAEWMIARGTHVQYGCLSCYSTTMVLGAAAVSLPLAGGLDATGMSLALASYVGLYGGSELLLGARMLFVEYRSQHPAKLLSEAGRLQESQPVRSMLRPLALQWAAGSTTCSECPAATLCLDESLSGQLRGIAAQPVPAIVRSMRAEAVLAAAAGDFLRSCSTSSFAMHP